MSGSSRVSSGKSEQTTVDWSFSGDGGAFTDVEVCPALGQLQLSSTVIYVTEEY